MSPGVATPCPAAPPMPMLSVCFISDLLAGICSGDVAFQLLNCFRLTGDDPLHQVPDRDHPEHGVTLQNRKVTKTMLGHDGHAFVDRVPRTYKDDGRGHDLADGGFFRRMPLQDHLAGIVAFRHDANKATVGNYKQSSDAVLCHPFNRFKYRLPGFD